jgi:hypothetical protein
MRLIALGLVLLLRVPQDPELKPGAKLTDKPLGFEIALFKDAAEIPVRRTTKPVNEDLTWYESRCVRSWVVQGGEKDPTRRMRILVGHMDGDAGAPSEWVERFSEMKAEGDDLALASDTHAGRAFVKRRDDASPPLVLLYKWPASWNREKTTAAVQASAKSFAWTKPAAAPAREHKIDGVKATLTSAHTTQIDRVKRDLDGLASWWYAVTDHYVIASNIDATAQKAFVAQLATNLEHLHRAYRAHHPPKKEFTAVSLVKIFSHRDQLFAHFSERKPDGLNLGVIGMWISVYDELVLTHEPSANPKNTLAVLYHEGFHQYVHYAVGEIDPPRWFDEGTGDYFGGAEVDADGVRFLENPQRTGTITKIVDGTFKKQYGWEAPALATLVQLSREEFYREVKWLVFQYTVAWSLVYYLRQGIERDSPYAGALDRYLDTYAESGSQEKAYEAAFGPIDMDRLQKDWLAFWQSPDARKKAQERRPKK